MLNLVQVQEQLKGLPMEAIMQYANGGNPTVPPYVALAELNRRKDMQASAPMQQQNPEQQPTVADQVKQAIMAPMQQMQPQMPPQGADPSQGGVASLQPQGAPMGFAEGGYTGFDRKDAPDRKNMSDEENPLLKFFRKLMEMNKDGDRPWKAEEQPGTDMSQADRVVERYGDSTQPEFITPPQATAPPRAPAAPPPTTGSTGVAGLPSAKLRTGPAAAAASTPPANYEQQYRAAMGRIEGGMPNQPQSDEEIAAQIAKMQAIFGIKEPGQERTGRIDAMEQIMRERQETYKKQQAGRGFDNTIESLRAYAQANPYNRYGSVAGAYGQLKDKDNAADLAEVDKRMELTAKIDELRALTEASQQAFRQGNLAQYTALKNKQEETKLKIAELRANTEGKVYTTESSNATEIQKQKMGDESRERVAATAAAARRAALGGGGPNNPKEMAIYQRAAADVGRELDKSIEYKMMDPEQQEEVKARMIQKRFSEIKAATGAAPTMPGAAPASSGVVDFSSLK